MEADTLVGCKLTAATTVSTSVEEHPSPFGKSRMQPRILLSCLKRRGAKNTNCRTSTHRRRVRGLWNPTCCCLFSHLHNEFITNILSFLNMKDLLASFQVCRRWNHVAASPILWERVDATDFVQATFEQYSKGKTKDASIATSHTLQYYLQQYANNIKSLTICSIQNALDANTFLPNISSSLQELTLTGYTNLTDTHIQVMFLSSKRNNIHSLVLNGCPLLTNVTLESISRHAQQLQSLSLRECRNITNIHALQGIWDIATGTKNMTSTISLQSLFAPMNAAAPAQTPSRGGNLRRLDICGTGVTSHALVECLQAVKGTIRLQELCISSDLWNDLPVPGELVNAVDKTSWKRVKICHANGLMTTMDKMQNHQDT